MRKSLIDARRKLQRNLNRPCVLLSPSVRSHPSIGLDDDVVLMSDGVRLLSDGIL